MGLFKKVKKAVKKVGGGVLDIATGGAISSSKAAKDAAKTQSAAAGQANDFLAGQYGSAIDATQPYIEGGKNAYSKLLALTGVSKNGTDTPESILQSDPSYQFRLDQGTQALTRSAAARGGLLSGGFSKDLTDYAQGSASQEYGNIYSRLAGIAQGGQSQANQNVSNALQYGGMIGDNITGAGNATAAGKIAAGNRNANIFSNALNVGALVAGAYGGGANPLSALSKSGYTVGNGGGYSGTLGSYDWSKV